MNRIATVTIAALLVACGAPGARSPLPDPAEPVAANAPAPAEPDTHGAPAPSVARLGEYLSRLEAMGFSGAALVEHRGEVVLRQGYGLADRETRRPYTPETVQTHGSITKQMTAAAILLLEARGALSVEDPLGRHFDGVPEAKRGITLHHLLTHSAGFPGALGRDREPIGAEELVERAFAAPLAFEPGSAYAYSNVGYSLLGIVVERVSGRPYEAFLRQELLLPAGLADTGYLLPDWEEERLAVGYLDGERWGRVYGRGWRDDGPGWHLRANGGLHTTVDDMHRWLAVLEGEGPLPAAAVEKWTARKVAEREDDPEYGYAYGWEAAATPAGPMTAHNGGNGIFSADFIWLPEAELFFYLQGNTSVVPAAELREMLAAAAFDPGFTLPPAIAADPDADPATAAARAGVYRVEDGAVRVETDDVRLLASLSGQPVLDRVLGHDSALRARLAGFNERATEAMRRLEAGREDALEGLIREGDDPVAPARRLLERMERHGVESLTLVGGIANEPGTRFADDAPWTTFFRAERPDGNPQAWSVLWREDGTYFGLAVGPISDFPAYVLIPTDGSSYAAVEREPPWRQLDARIADSCLRLGALTACR